MLQERVDKLARTAFDDAIAELDNVAEDSYNVAEDSYNVAE